MPQSHPADRLLRAIADRRAPVCVGIDPVIEKLPAAVLSESPHQLPAHALFSFCTQVLHAVAPYVPCVKLQSACFERYRAPGVRWLYALLHVAHALKLEVILDWKRGDIGISAHHYAAAAFDVPAADDPQLQGRPDWTTVHTYLGEDAITPFLRPGRGAFALVRTSNPAGDELQSLPLAAGGTLADAVAGMVARLGASHLGTSGYSSLGAVVGATKPADAQKLRQIMPQQVFLVPGYGAQGAGPDDVLPCFKSDGSGAIITASRSVIFAFQPADPNWAASVADAAARFADEIARAVGMR